MTWTYEPPSGDPVAWPSLKDQVRFLIGDTKQSAWSPSDEDIAGATLLWNEAHPEFADNPYGIASTIAVAIGDWIGLEGVTSTSKSVGNSSLSKSYGGNRSTAWRRLAVRLAAKSPVPIPGASYANFGLAGREPEYRDRLFTIGQMDNGRGGDSGFFEARRLER